MTTSPSTTSSSGLYDWCDVATSVQRKTYSRKITAATSSSCKTLKKAKKQALLPTRTTFRQQHEAMQRRHGLTGCRFEPRSTAVSTAFAPQLPRLRPSGCRPTHLFRPLDSSDYSINPPFVATAPPNPSLLKLDPRWPPQRRLLSPELPPSPTNIAQLDNGGAENAVVSNSQYMPKIFVASSAMKPHGNEGEVAPEVAQDGSSRHKKKAAKGEMVSFRNLFRYADETDYTLIAIGTVAAIATGIAQPLRILLMGNVVTAFNPVGGSYDSMVDQVAKISINFASFGVGVVLAGFVQVMAWTYTSSRQAERLRVAFIAGILKQDIGWFDVNNSQTLSTKITESVLLIQDGIGRKVGDYWNSIAMAIAGIAIGFKSGWKLSLVVVAFLPLLVLGLACMMKTTSRAVQNAIKAYGQAGAAAEESLSNIRTVHVFNAMPASSTKYNLALRVAEAAGIKKGLMTGIGGGFTFMMIFMTYAVAIAYGAVLVASDNLSATRCTSDCYDGGKVLTVFFGVIMGAMALGQANPSMEAIVSARAAAFEAYATIDRPSKVDALSDDGIKLDNVNGEIDLVDVEFQYPSRPHIPVCKGYSLKIAAGEKVALVGPSGSGKSTIVSLVERFYDPVAGIVKLDGVDLKTLNPRWLRQQIGLVGQEPCLFADTIAVNIGHGKPNATIEEIHDAARRANAFDFILSFPQGFDTVVGDRGAQLSGGQKQRIAIARAIIKNPAILLLDEATSALDTESERIVQESLDALLDTRKRTTIIIAHRLATIRNADRIVVLSQGRVVEQGSHDELMELQHGEYRMLVEAQSRKSPKKAASLQSPPRTTLAVSATTGASMSTHVVVEKEKAVPPPPPPPSAKARIVVPYRRIWALSQAEWKYLVLGMFGAVVTGATFPLWGVLLSQCIALFFNFRLSENDMKTQGLTWAGYFLVLGVAYCIGNVAQNYGFSVVSERLTARLRAMGFQAMLMQEIGWYDAPEHAAGALQASLSTDCALIQKMSSDLLKNVLNVVVCLSVGFSIAFYHSWQMTLALLGVFPLMGFASKMRAKTFQPQQNKESEIQGDLLAGALLSEAIGSIRTVASFGMEEAIVAKFCSHVATATAETRRSAAKLGVVFGLSQAMMFFSMAFLFWFGGYLISHQIILFSDMFTVLMALMMSSFGLGTAAQSLGDSAKAKQATANVFAIIDRQPTIDCDAGTKLATVVGRIEFQNVRFAYPSRPHSMVYKDYNLVIEPGTTVALVGSSGSGKSTAIGLIERFYDPLEGRVLFDGVDIRSLNLTWLREHISLVGQEPVLFVGTIADNIATGKPGSSQDEIEKAAKMGNAHDFIVQFPDGYKTQVGDRGIQLSGGQKQRIAIARAILRDPEVLLLDEATSALDNESERIVQESLDALLEMKKRTTVIVAHRLTTIQNADVIAVANDGRIVEQGTHSELMEIPSGLYRTLVSRQVQVE